MDGAGCDGRCGMHVGYIRPRTMIIITLRREGGGEGGRVRLVL